MGDNLEVVTHDDSSSDEPNSEGAAPPARNGLKRARLALHDSGAPVEEAKEFKDVETQTESDAEKELKKRAQVPFPPKEKNFVVKRRLMNVERMTEDARVGTRFVEHFGTLWNFSIFRNKNHLAIRISNDSSGVTHGNGQWSIKLGYDVTMKSGSSCEKNVSGTHKFGSHGDSESCFFHPKFVSVHKVVGLTLDFELRITILSMSGFYAKNLTEFDVSVAETSDAILVVNDRKFFVSRLKTVLNECRNHWNIREVVPENLEDLDHSVLAILLEKALANR
ncbi:hypothetical protein CAEBREN_11777 [Caenorhabditis brenneri]|uniref:MATH domain-containing protein n=1 Tax=Caenorhabditis brenneri TaxID=135651 RepID=G0MD17_CAEBE|nr:hypothetical protein CAEBREN_11777 [Caenorhabditis brenneri]